METLRALFIIFFFVVTSTSAVCAFLIIKKNMSVWMFWFYVGLFFVGIIGLLVALGVIPS